MKTLCKYCVKKPVTMLMAVLIIVVFGIFALTRMSLALFPNLNLPYAVVVTTYVGANPEQVEKEVSIPIEQQMVTLTNYHALTSTSNEHYSMIMIEFEDNTNMDNAFLEMREAVDSISFPDGVGKPRIMRITADMMPIVTVSIAKKYDEGVTPEQGLIKTTQWVQNELEGELVKIDGVAQISYTGSADVVLSMNFDSNKLDLYGLTSDKILQIIEDTNDANGLIGITTDTDGLKMLYIGDPTKTIEELNKLPIAYDGAKVIRISDVLSSPITFKNNDTSSYNKINGLEGITVSFQQDSSAELTTVVKNIKKAFDKITKDNPDVQVIYILDQGEYVETSIGTVIDNLIQGALLAVIILLIFLLSIKPTLIVAISIPVSVIATFAAMYFAGINLNIVSMGGLALGIGMLVDNSVVVIENIFRMIKNGKSKKAAAILGAAEVGGAITASTLTTLAVFIPIMFLKGLAGSIFKEMALTVCFSLGCSLIIALTIVPSFAAKFLTDKDDEVKESKLKSLDEKINSNKKLGYTVTGLVIALIAISCAIIVKFALKLSIVYAILIALVLASFMIVALISSRGKLENEEGKITKTYEKAIRWSINHKTIVLISSIVLLVVSTFLALTRGFALIPATDEGSISGSIVIDSTMPSSYVYSVADECTQTIMDASKDIDIIQTRVGSTSLMATILGQSGGGSTINFTIALKDDRVNSTKKNRQIIEEKIREEIDMDYVEDIEFKEAESMTSMLGTSGTMIYVEGSNLYELEAVANDLVKVLDTVEGVEKPNNGVTQGDDTVKITVNKDEAIKLGLYSMDYSNAVNLLYKGLGYDINTAGKETLKVTIDGVQYELSTSATASIENYKMDKSLFLGSIAVFDNNLYQLLDTYEGHVYIMNPQLAAILAPEQYKQTLISYGCTEEQAQALLLEMQRKLMTGEEKIIILNPNLYYDGNKIYVVIYTNNEETANRIESSMKELSKEGCCENLPYSIISVELYNEGLFLNLY